jgi:hypothetical protein
MSSGVQLKKSLNTNFLAPSYVGLFFYVHKNDEIKYIQFSFLRVYPYFDITNCQKTTETKLG